VRQGGAGGEIEDEIVVDSGALPHEEVAAVQENVQADECEHAAGAKAETMLLKVKKKASLFYHETVQGCYLKVIIHA